MRQAGLSLLVGIGIGLTAAFLLVAHDRSQRAVEALGQAYEASRPTGTPVVQAVPIENPPPVSPGSAAQGGAPQTAQNPDQNAVQPLASSQAPTDTPLALGGSPGGTSRAASGEGTSRALPFLGVRCENREDGAYIVELWPNSGWDKAFLILGGIPPEPFGIHKPALPAMLGALYNTCDDLKRDLSRYKPGQEYHIDLFDRNYPARSEYVVRLITRPLNASDDWF
ncbi:hypothetical protein CSW14_07780 [Thermus scotoductus]|uniref:Uncharacterized protein n=2 Tax=Thermus scotoductus TaxID=37636 RepID=A0A430VMN2_THESC|nr:hypothetical protein CSW14_07780 [Thermus scotoductus]